MTSTNKASHASQQPLDKQKGKTKKTRQIKKKETTTSPRFTHSKRVRAQPQTSDDPTLTKAAKAVFDGASIETVASQFSIKPELIKTRLDELPVIQAVRSFEQLDSMRKAIHFYEKEGLSKTAAARKAGITRSCLSMFLWRSSTRKDFSVEEVACAATAVCNGEMGSRRAQNLYKIMKSSIEYVTSQIGAGLYKPPGDYDYSEKGMLHAMRRVLIDNMSVSDIASECNVPQDALKFRVDNYDDKYEYCNLMQTEPKAGKPRTKKTPVAGPNSLGTPPAESNLALQTAEQSSFVSPITAPGQTGLCNTPVTLSNNEGHSYPDTVKQAFEAEQENKETELLSHESYPISLVQNLADNL